MSAWLCSQDHIAVIVNAFGEGQTVKACAANFKMLVKENLRSLESRYPGRDFLKDWQKEAKGYRYETAAPADMTQVIKCCDSFDYQACESDDYRDTKAAAFVESVRAKAAIAGGHQAGPKYNAAEWSL